MLRCEMAGEGFVSRSFANTCTLVARRSARGRRERACLLPSVAARSAAACTIDHAYLRYGRMQTVGSYASTANTVQVQYWYRRGAGGSILADIIAIEDASVPVRSSGYMYSRSVRAYGSTIPLVRCSTVHSSNSRRGREDHAGAAAGGGDSKIGVGTSGRDQRCEK